MARIGKPSDGYIPPQGKNDALIKTNQELTSQLTEKNIEIQKKEEAINSLYSQLNEVNEISRRKTQELNVIQSHFDDLKQTIIDLESKLRAKELEINAKDQAVTQIKCKLNEISENSREKVKELNDVQEQNNHFKEKIEDLESKLRAKDLEINEKDEATMHLKTKLNKNNETLVKKTQELKNAQEENKQLKKEIENFSHSFQNKERELKELNNRIQDIIGGSKAMEFLENILRGFDDELIQAIKSEELDIDNIKQSLENNFKKVSDDFIRNRIELIANLCDKKVRICNEHLEKLDKSKIQVSEVMNLNSGVFTEADVNNALAPVIQKIEKEELVREKWDKLKNQLDSFFQENQNCFGRNIKDLV